MMRYCFLLFNMLLLSSLFAQRLELPFTDTAYQMPVNKPIIRGKVINASPEELQQLNIGYSLVVPTSSFQESYSLKTQADGSFELFFPHNAPLTQVWFKLDNYAYTCLYADEELLLTFDLAKLKKSKVYLLGEGLEFGGKDAQLNEGMNAYELYCKKVLPHFFDEVERIKADKESFLVRLDSMYNVLREMNKEFLSSGYQHCAFLIASETDLSYCANKISFMLDNKIKLDLGADLLPPVYAISNDSHHYFTYLYFYLRSVYNRQNTSAKSTHALLSLIKSVLPKAYADLTMMQLRDLDLVVKSALYGEVDQQLSTPWLKGYMSATREELAAKIADLEAMKLRFAVPAGSSSLGAFKMKTDFMADLYLNEHKTAAELLSNLKSAFKDQLVIIDIWGTWCMPCLQAMPFSKKLHHAALAEELPVAFVYLCTSAASSEEKWTNKVLELEQPGTHIFVEQSLINDLFKIFNRSGYPTVVALKPNGEFDTKAISWISQTTLEHIKLLLQ